MRYKTSDDDKCTVTELCRVTDEWRSSIHKQIRDGRMPYEHDGVRSYIRFDSLANYKGLIFAKRAKAGVLFLRYADKSIGKFSKGGRFKTSVEEISQIKTDLCARVLTELPQSRKELEQIAREEWDKICS